MRGAWRSGEEAAGGAGRSGGRPSFRSPRGGVLSGFWFLFPGEVGWQGAAGRVGLGSSLEKALTTHPVLSPRDVAGGTRASCPLRGKGPGVLSAQEKHFKENTPYPARSKHNKVTHPHPALSGGCNAFIRTALVSPTLRLWAGIWEGSAGDSPECTRPALLRGVRGPGRWAGSGPGCRRVTVVGKRRSLPSHLIFQGSDSLSWGPPQLPHLHPRISQILFWPEQSQMRNPPPGHVPPRLEEAQGGSCKACGVPPGSCWLSD